jgi:hypothetical protein
MYDELTFLILYPVATSGSASIDQLQPLASPSVPSLTPDASGASLKNDMSSFRAFFSNIRQRSLQVAPADPWEDREPLHSERATTPPTLISQEKTDSSSPRDPPHASRGHFRGDSPEVAGTTPPEKEQSPLWDRASSPAAQSFASLSSPAHATRFPSLPPSPSFDSQVLGYTRPRDPDLIAIPDIIIRKRPRIESPRDSKSQDRPLSTEASESGQLSRKSPSPQRQPSAGSHDLMEQRLSQKDDMNVDNDSDGSPAAHQSNANNSHSGLSKKTTSTTAPCSPGQDQDEGMTIATQSPTSQAWEMDLKSQRPILSPQASQFDSQSQYPPLSYPQSSSFNSSPWPLLTQAQRQTWYQASPVGRKRS